MTEIERRETGLTLAEAERLQEAAIAGDAAAQRRLDAEATSAGYADFDAMMQTIVGELFAAVNAALGKSAYSGGNLTDDPACKTIKAAYARPQNDPAVRAALRAARKMPVLHFVRMTREEALAGHDTAVTQPEEATAVTHAVVNRLAGVVTDTARRQAWDYTRQTEGDRAVFTFYGQGQHFEGVRHVIGLAIVAPPGTVRLSRRFEFSKSKGDVRADYEARGHDPALVDSPALHPYGLPEEDDMLPAAVIVAADHQYRVIVERLREELAKAEQERDTAGTQEATAGGAGQGVGKSTGNKGTAWLKTEGKIQSLIRYRQEAIENTGEAPKFSQACNAIPIDGRTVEKHAAQLKRRWTHADYLPEPHAFDGGNW